MNNPVSFVNVADRTIDLTDLVQAAETLAKVLQWRTNVVLSKVSAKLIEHDGVRQVKDFFETALNWHDRFGRHPTPAQELSVGTEFNDVTPDEALNAIDLLAKVAGVERDDIVDVLIGLEVPRGGCAWLSDIVDGCHLDFVKPCFEARIHDLADEPLSHEDGWRMIPGIPAQARFLTLVNCDEDAFHAALVDEEVACVYMDHNLYTIGADGLERVPDNGRCGDPFVMEFVGMSPKVRDPALASCKAIHADAKTHLFTERDRRGKSPGDVPLDEPAAHAVHPSVIDLAMSALEITSSEKPTPRTWGMIADLRNGKSVDACGRVDEIRREMVRRTRYALENDRAIEPIEL